MQELVFLTKDHVEFWKTTGGMLAARIGEETYDSLFLHCSFPHTDKRIYISVRTPDHKEVGLIRSLDDFSEDTAALLETYIQLRYFAPKIKQVLKIKEEFGYSYWETETDAGNYHFTVRSGGANVKLVTDKKLMITDVDGNRFMIEDINEVSEKEFRMIEMCM